MFTKCMIILDSKQLDTCFALKEFIIWLERENKHVTKDIAR